MLFVSETVDSSSLLLLLLLLLFFLLWMLCHDHLNCFRVVMSCYDFNLWSCGCAARYHTLPHGYHHYPMRKKHIMKLSCLFEKNMLVINVHMIPPDPGFLASVQLKETFLFIKTLNDGADSNVWSFVFFFLIGTSRPSPARLYARCYGRLSQVANGAAPPHGLAYAHG